MATLIGILVDVSGSMQASMGDTHTRRRGEWARANFDLIDDLIKYDVSSRNLVFSLGFGANRDPVVFDLLNTIEKTRNRSVSANLSLREILEQILNILETSGAPRVKKWGEMDVLLSAVDKRDAELFLDKLTNNEKFRERFVKECLPDACRNKNVENAITAAKWGMASTNILGLLFPPALLVTIPATAAGIVGVTVTEEIATKSSVKEAVEKGKKLLAEFPEFEFAAVSDGAVMKVHRAREILHGNVKKEGLTDQRVDELMEQVRPFIYGATPLMAALDATKCLFGIRKFKDYDKLLFILSDGISTDGTSPPVAELSDLGVKTVSCYITNNQIPDPKRLYSRSNPSWDDAAKLMFRMSSPITTRLIPRTVFIKRGWKIDIDDNETKLFVQVNHPDIIEEACDLARDVVCCQDAMSDLLSSVSLDLYINKANTGFQPKEQKGGTCYANASAAVLHLAMQRIVGREGGYPNFFQLRDEIIAKYGEHGANTLRVLQEICPNYRLHCQAVDTMGALKAIAEKRPVIATFQLTKDEWDIFSAFYQRTPYKVLSKHDLRIRRSIFSMYKKLEGHAVVMTSFDSQGLRLMNSWGDSWADGGFFRVSDADVLGLEFIDVYWTISDLKRSEIAAYDAHGATIAQKLMSRLKGLQIAQYECPLCQRKSRLVEFSGHALATSCPKCRQTFRIENPGDDLALNLYLLSLSARERHPAH